MMKLLSRAALILVDPSAEWAQIEKEPADTVDLMTHYVALLAVVPALFGFIGACVIGTVVPGTGTVRASLFDGVFGAIFFYLETYPIVFLLGLSVGLSAPLFGGRRDFPGAFKLTVYSLTPVWLAGVFLLLPGLQFLLLTGLYGFYLLLTGLPPLLKSPPRKSVVFAVLIAVFAGALAFGAGIAQRMIFVVPGGI